MKTLFVVFLTLLGMAIVVALVAGLADLIKARGKIKRNDHARNHEPTSRLRILP